MNSLADVRLGTSLPFAGSQLGLESRANWDALLVVYKPSRLTRAELSGGLSRSISVSCPHGALEWSSGKGAEPAGGEGMRAEMP